MIQRPHERSTDGSLYSVILEARRQKRLSVVLVHLLILEDQRLRVHCTILMFDDWHVSETSWLRPLLNLAQNCRRLHHYCRYLSTLSPTTPVSGPAWPYTMGHLGSSFRLRSLLRDRHRRQASLRRPKCHPT